MKVLERLVLAHLRPQGDPLQLTNQHNLGVDDVIIYILERLHFRRYNSCTVRIIVFEFSHPFNMIQLLLLREEMEKVSKQVNMSTISWITT